MCPANYRCHLSERPLLEVLGRAARDNPHSGYLTGLAVSTLARFGQHLEAMQIAEACETEDWWCSALKGHVFQSVGRVGDAERHLRRFAEAAPDSIRCGYADATWLLGPFLQRRPPIAPPRLWETRWADRPCEVRMAASDTIWWLADPLYVVEGNDRWTEHVDRHLKARWYEETNREATPRVPLRESRRQAVWAGITRRGPWDSFEFLPELHMGFEAKLWTSRKAARYHFVPDFEGEGFSRPTWRLEGDYDDEGYTPPYGPFYLLPAQVARFRSLEAGGDAVTAAAMRIATAASTAGTPISEAADTANLIYTDAPESFPLHLKAAFHEARAVFLPETPPGRYVTSLEVLTPEGIGWHRRMLEPLALRGPGLSDVLLYEPVGLESPDSLLAATGMMLGTTELEAGREVGLYWEVYGAEPEAPIEFELELRNEGGGLVALLRRLLPGGPQEGSGTLSWVEAAGGAVSPKAVVLETSTISPGAYTLVLRASWPGQEPPLETRRAFRVR